MTGPLLREYHHAREFVRCPGCGDFCELTGTEAQRAADAEWFRAHHRETETGCARSDERNATRRRKR